MAPELGPPRPHRAPRESNVLTIFLPTPKPTGWEELAAADAGGGAAHPLSVSQEHLWFLDRLAPARPVYHELIAIEHLGRLDVAALTAALETVISRHEAWRSTFRTDGASGEPIMVVGPVVALELGVLDLGHLSEDDAEDQAAAWMAEVSGHPYRLDTGPLVRPHLVRLPADRDRLYLAMHHIVFDGVSVYRTVLRQVATAYEAAAAGLAIPLGDPQATYEDFARWERRWIDGDKAQRRVDWWQQHLAGAEALELPLDRPRPQRRSWSGNTVTWSIEAPVVASLKAIATAQRASLFQVLASAFAAVLACYSGQDEVLFATAADTRQRPEHRDVVGYCLTPLLLRVALDDDPTFAALVGRVRDELLDGLDHLVPFERVVRAVGPGRAGDSTPLFSAMIILEPPASSPDPAWQPVSIEGRVSDAMGASKFHLEMGLDERPDGRLAARLIYDTDLWDRWRAEAFAAQWREVLHSVVEQPDLSVSDLARADACERRRLAAVNATDCPLPPVPFHDLIERQARRSSDAVAVSAGADTLTYAELDLWADLVAADLVRAGVTPGRVVAVCVERSAGMVAALLGVMKSGAAFLPLDPAAPVSRLADMVSDAEADVVLVGPGAEPVGEATGASRLIPLPGRPEYGRDVPPVQVDVEPDAPCYVLFTSGSTGRPKGTVIAHSGLLNLITFFRSRLAISPSDVVLALTTISFDISMLELFLPLVAGARVVVAAPGTGGDGAALARLLREERITLAQATPTTWRALIDSGWSGLPGLVGICGGEPMPADLAEGLLARGVELYNAYGPTETTIWSTLERVERGRPITIGRPIANTRLTVIGKHGQLQPVGVPGELVIGGVGVAAGYLNRPELTAERFVPDPARQGSLAYRTGDRVRWRPDGRLEHLGRLDEQVKLRGHRIEPGEVAHALRSLPGVENATVVLRSDDGIERLVAYVTGTPPAVNEMREALAERLPPVMVPSAYVTLERIPTTMSGKVDKAALPAPVRTKVTAPAAALSNDEAELAELWGQALGCSVGPDDDFFDLGGNSLLAVRLIHEVERRWGLTIPVSAMLGGGANLRSMAALLTERSDGRGAAPASPPASPRQASGRPPLYMIFPHAWGQLAARHFAAALHDDPVVALRVPTLQWRFDESRTIEQLAAELVESIRSQQSEGPYSLAGFSLGGIVAYEAAGQLRSLGHDVEWLGLLDALAPAARERGTLALPQRLRRRVESGLRPSAREAHIMVSGWANDLRVRTGRPVRYVFDWTGARLLVESYAPRGHDVPTTVFATSGSDGEPGDLGWGALHRGDLRIVGVPGDHNSMLKQPAVAEAADRLAAELRTARKGWPRSAEPVSVGMTSISPTYS